MRVRALLIAGLASLAAAAPAQADIFTVTDGSSDSTAACVGTTCVSLRAAIAAAEATKGIADTINVPAGTININNDLVILSDITINGVSARSNIIDGGAKYRGFRVSSTGSAKINHFTIRNAAGGQGGLPDGGGILNDSGVVQLTYVRVTGSHAASGGSGGGIANVEGTLTMAHSLVDNNTASTGAGVANVGGVESPDRGLFGAVDSTIFKNTAALGGTGGIDSRGGTLNIVILNRSTLADNVGGVRGVGGLGIFSGTAQVLTSLFTRNLVGTATLNCAGTLPTSSTNNVEDDKECGFDLGGVVSGLATSLSTAGGELDVLALTAASPAVDRAPVSACSAANTSDQRDMVRPQGPGCDAGAYELDQAPTMTITSGPSGTIGVGSAAFTFSTTEPGVPTVQCRLTGPGQPGTFANCSSLTAQSYAGLANGSYTFSVRGMDGVFPTPPITSQSFVVDVFDTTITGGPTGTITDNTPTFTFTGSGGAVGFQCRFDTAGFVGCTSPFTPAIGLADGPHTFEVRALTAAGGPDPTPASRSFTVDATAPDTTITSGPSGTIGSTSATFVYTSTESPSTFQCALDGAAFSACPASYTGLAQGSHTFQVRATDAAGNVDATPASRTWTVDTIAPDTTITAGPSGSVASTSATFTYTSTETPQTFQCSLDGAAFSACPANYTGLSQGSHTFQVRATDAAGNVDATPASRTWTVDTVTPNTTIDSGPPSPTNDPTPTFTFSSNEAGTFRCRIDAAAFGPCVSPLTTDALGEGSHTFEVRAIDTAGNTDPTPASQTFVVDTSIPDTTITGAPGASTNDTTPTFTFTGSSGTTSFQCRVDGAAYAGCTSPFTTAVLTAGSHTVEIRARNAAQTPDPSPATRTFVVDLTPPDTTLTPIASPTNDATPTFSFGSTEAGSTFACRVDGASFATCSSAFTTAALAAGSHTFDVRATDPAGNLDTTPASQTFVVDLTAPDTTITSSPPGIGASPQFTFVSPDAGASFECKLDAAAFAPCTSPKTYSGLSDGQHTFSVRAQDTAGNDDATPAEMPFVVDTSTPPAPDLGGGPSGPTTDSNPSFSFSSPQAGTTFECALDSAAFAPCTSPKSYTGVTPGEHTFKVRTVDPFGPSEPTTRTFTVTAVQQAHADARADRDAHARPDAGRGPERRHQTDQRQGPRQAARQHEVRPARSVRDQERRRGRHSRWRGGDHPRRRWRGEVLRRHLQAQPVRRVHDPDPHGEAHGLQDLEEEGRGRGQEAQDPQALGRRQGQVPHPRPVQRRHHPRHQMARPGHLHHDGDQGRPGRRRRQRFRQEEDFAGQEGQDLHGTPQEEVARRLSLPRRAGGRGRAVAA